VKWFDHKCGTEGDSGAWVKTHLVCGVKTNIVTSAELTMGNEYGSRFLPELVLQTTNYITAAKTALPLN